MPHGPQGARQALITRFSVPPRDGRSQSHLDEVWIDRRIELLRRFCLPSVLAQTVTRFDWYVGIDARTNSGARERIARVCDGRAELLAVTSRDQWPKAIEDAIRMKGSWSLTTRLDSDDAIAPTFLERVREHARPERLLNFSTGAVFDLSSGRAGLRRYRSNPFLSLLAADGRHVHQVGSHAHARRVLPLDDVRTREPMWVQFVHGGNKTNEFHAHYRPIDPANVLSIASVRLDLGIDEFVGVDHRSQFRWIVAAITHGGRRSYRAMRRALTQVGSG